MRLRKEADEMLEEEILLIAKVSDALAHPARIKIYRFIMQNNRNRIPVCNKDVVAAFDYSQATISQHIKKLAEAGLIQTKKEDKYSIYYANIGILGKYLDATKKFE
ncbi:MAG: metalloregulator ArsR/SmtB family transcription factor [Eubacteriales bacterium]|nr:metalloregulator ArsR/SmtB family transcription factor [Eubacteriales bacterium]MDD3200074.1 metalloregulator ArsR/SmtB family transcription factor [Eubacteriales bacterium]MDD4122452.1 metalloregulator ArsR/SmtB family transcription factor [Eubacteriales bacterium]MDD4630364.1 metalloregulator ArsR/SmtB family transcription factor [Eubacteriales bacterium]